MGNLIDPATLQEQLDEPSLRIVDVRFQLSDTDWGERQYREAHLPGAIYLQLDRDLSSPVGRHGGRHPLPDPVRLAGRLAESGIGNDSKVVVYDAGDGMVASRFWWLLRYLGHDDVKVLDGGFAAWREQGGPLTGELPDHPPRTFEVDLRPQMTVDRDYVLRNLHNPAVRLIDARAAERYRGEIEPLDPKAGHIPSAINLPFAENLEEGRFRKTSELRRRFEAAVAGADEVVVYCGSGVSAAHDLLALEEAGVEGARLYPGSWSDWSSYEDSPVATGDEP